ncbi:hypothetical protein A6A25_34495 [Saccharothrix sp. CB00851]|nr:hypothetical protein A6A25_34495 [Saccharothrix sp. CB00851]
MPTTGLVDLRNPENTVPLDDPHYEAFLPHHTASKHRVMAITRSPGHTQLHALATVSDAITARRLADALNSRLLGRRNHTERLDAALVGMPDSVVAAIRQLPIDPVEVAQWGRPPLAHRVYGDPIDGILLFPTTACTPGKCASCQDCANDCQNCAICEEAGCENCIPPDLTPRTAHLLATAGSVLADQYFDHADHISDRNPSADELRLLPAIMRRQPAEFVRRMARAFDDLVDDLHDGVEPRPHDMAEQIALDLIIQDAEAMHTDSDMLNDLDQGLPDTPYDYDFDVLYDLLFEDTDHIGYLSSKHAPAAPGELEYLFERFYSLEERDPNRGFRR